MQSSATLKIEWKGDGYMQPAIELKSVSKKYQQFMLRDVSFSLPSGGILGLIGENGAGKTTTLKLILNLIRRDSGQIRLMGLDNIKNEKAVKEQMGVVLDESYFDPQLTPREISAVMKCIFSRWDGAVFSRWLDRFSISETKRVKELSKGMKMKLSIATALSHSPRLLVMDEATSALDPVIRNEILDVFQEFVQREDHSVLLSTHITSDLERIADYIVYLHQGRVALRESKDTLLYQYGIMKCGKSGISRVDPEDIVGKRENSFGAEILVKDAEQMRRKYRDFVFDPPSLEQIMLFFAKGEKL